MGWFSTTRSGFAKWLAHFYQACSSGCPCRNWYLFLMVVAAAGHRRRRNALTSLALGAIGATGCSSGCTLVPPTGMAIGLVTTFTTSLRMCRRCRWLDQTRGSRGAASPIAVWCCHLLQFQSQLPVWLRPPAPLAMSATRHRHEAYVQLAARSTSRMAQRVTTVLTPSALTTSAAIPRPAMSARPAASRTSPMAAHVTPV